MKNYSPILLIVGATAIAALAFERHWLRNELGELQSELRIQTEKTQRLTQDIASLKAEIQDSRPALAPQVSAPSIPVAERKVAEDRGKASAESQQLEVDPETAVARVASWRAKEFVSHVSDHIALSVEEKEALGAQFSAVATGVRGPDDASRKQVIAQVLGEERLQAFEDAERARLKEERTRALEEESVILSRRLSLTPDQEVQLRSVLEQVEVGLEPMRSQVREVMREAMANHFGGDEAKTQLKEQYDLIRTLNDELKKQRAEQLFGALADTLTDAQKNALLEHQAKQ